MSANKSGTWEFVLATDLDGTFLGGSRADRRSLYARIDARRTSMGLVFVTGRDPDFIESLCGKGEVPWPDFVVGDVGTTIARVHNLRLRPIVELEDAIARSWGDRGAEVCAALADAPGLRLQPTSFRYRVSYDFSPEEYDGEAGRIIEAMGLDHLISNDCYFDVLPRGVSKGPSLLRLLEHMRAPRDSVLVAGDTLNDLSLFETGLRAVAVGGAEPALVERVKDRPHVHVADGVGAAGITEAMGRFGF